VSAYGLGGSQRFMEREDKTVLPYSGWDVQTRWRGGGTSTALIEESRTRVHMRHVPGPRRAKGRRNTS
jgi:hypothetical protein